MKKWYALHTRPYAEGRVEVQLAKLDIETFAPGMRNAANGTRAQLIPLFPGYLFVHINLEKERTAVWLRYPGVRYLVGYDNEPVPVMEEVINVLRQKTAELWNEGRGPQPRFKRGGLVRIRAGLFADMLALFEGPVRPNQRVQVLLRALDRSMRLSLSLSEIEPVEADTTQLRSKRPRRTRGRGRRINS